MSEKQYYTAIDLGTTNSVIAYGNMQNNTMKSYLCGQLYHETYMVCNQKLPC